MCPKLCLPINVIIPGWHPHVEMVSGTSVHFRSYPAPRAWHSSPLDSALKLRKQHLMLLHFPLSALDFRSCLSFLKFAEFFPLFSSLSWTFSPLGILSFLLRLSVKILLVVQGPHSPCNLSNPRYPLLTLNSAGTFFCTTSYDLVSFSFVLLCGGTSYLL